MDKRKNLHGNQNGEIVFIDAFAGDTGSFLDQPTPATTKVSIKDDCVNLPGIYQKYLNEKKSIEDEKASEKKAREKELKEQRKKRTVPAAAPSAPAPAPEPVSVPISLVPLTLSSVAQVVGGGAATSAAAAPVQRKYTSMHLASCDGLYSDMPEVRVAVTQGTGAELVKNPSVSSVPKPKPRQAFLPEEVVSIIRDASKYMTQESFAAFKADMNSKYSLGME
jgi:phage protein D